VKLHDAKAFESHLNGHAHRTAVNQLLVTHSTHSKIKSAALNQKARKGVKINLPISNNNFWKYALLQQPTQLSAPSTFAPAPAPTIKSTSTTSNTTTPNVTPTKRQRTPDSTSQSSVPSSSINDTILTTLVKHGNRLDDMDKRLMSIEGVIHNLDMILSSYNLPPILDTQAPSLVAASASATTDAPDNNDNDVDNEDVLLVSEHGPDLSANEFTTTPSSPAPLHRTESAPVTSSTKRNKKRRISDRLDTPSSKNTRSHSRR